MVVAAYGLILPQWVLDRPPHGCINIHASLLPRWRGAAPIHRAIEAGDACSGITIMQMDAGLDTGDMLRVESIPIAPDDTTATLHDRLAALGGRLIVETLDRLAAGGLARTPQPDVGVTYARKIDKAEGVIDWREPAPVIERRIRAFDPFPGASTTLAGEPVKLWRASVSDASGAPGTVLDASQDAISIACGSGTLRVTELQRAGGKRLSAQAFAQGTSPLVGKVFGDSGD
jgi:methionyl-tRNA formyltransferase